MIVKQCQFPGRDDRGTYIHLLYPGEYNDHLIKEAQVGPPQLEHIREVVYSATRKNGHVYTLVSAMGAGEYWGSNSNGDDFPEEPLIHTPPGWAEMSLSRQRTVGEAWEWGYPTFYNAHAFQHHANKDVKRAFGSVYYSMWDTLMKRVLLVVDIGREAAQRLGAHGVVDKIDNGEFPDVSMGCKVPFDICSICADWSRILPLLGKPKKLLAEHRRKPIRGISVTRNDYCQHLRFEINKIYPDGRKVRMLNMHPRFFDISFVFIGADKTSKVMAKIAGRRCPIRDNSPMCKSGCYTCGIPSSHVHEVWSRGQVEMEKQAMGEYELPSGQRLKISISTAPSPELAEKSNEEKEEYWDDMYRRSLIRQAREKPNLGFTEEDVRAAKRVTPNMGKESATIPGFDREFQDEEKFASAFGIDKTAEIDLAKKAEIIKKIRSNFSKALPGMTDDEPEMPRDLMETLAQDLPDALASAGSMGIVVKPKEFQRMILIARGQPRLADDLDDHGLCFRPGAPASPDHMIGQVVPKLLDALAPLMGARSALAPPVHRRIIKITVVKPAKSSSLPEELEDNPVLNKLSADYSAYRQQLLYKFAALTRQLVHEHPWVVATLLNDLPEGSLSGGLVKAGGGVLESLIGMFPVDYLNRAHLDQPVSAYVDEHCDLEGLVTAGDLASCGRVA